MLENWFDRALEMKEKEDMSMADIASALGLHYDTVSKKFKKYYKSQVEALDEPEEDVESIQDFIFKSAMKNVLIDEVVDAYGSDEEEVRAIIREMQNDGVTIEVLGNRRLVISKNPFPSYSAVKEEWNGETHIKV